MEWLYTYASGWVGMWKAIFVLGTATDLRYILVGLVVSPITGYIAHRSMTRKGGYGRRRYIAEIALNASTGFFFWPGIVAIWCALSAVFVPALFVLVSFLLINKAAGLKSEHPS